jgi:hypothetical protein
MAAGRFNLVILIFAMGVVVMAVVFKIFPEFVVQIIEKGL